VLLSAYAPSRVIAAGVNQNGSIDGAAARVREQVVPCIAPLNPHLSYRGAYAKCQRETSLSLVNSQTEATPPAAPCFYTVINARCHEGGSRGKNYAELPAAARTTLLARFLGTGGACWSARKMGAAGVNLSDRRTTNC
jgi:hypothetical protein